MAREDVRLVWSEFSCRFVPLHRPYLYPHVCSSMGALGSLPQAGLKKVQRAAVVAFDPGVVGY